MSQAQSPLRWRLIWKRQGPVAALASLLAAPAFITFNYIFRFGVDVPYWDQWGFVPLLAELYQGKLPIRVLAAQANEHRIVFPRLLMLFLAWLTRYNTLAEMYASWLMLCGIVALLLMVHLRLFGFSVRSLAWFIPVPWLVFTLRQYDNLLWGWQLQIVLTCLFLFTALYLIETSVVHPGRFKVALGAAVGCTFSFGAGPLIWPVGLLQLLLLRARGKVIRMGNMALAWTVSGACSVALYLWGYYKPGGIPDALSFREHPGLFFLSIRVALGNALSDSLGGAATMGSFALFITLALVALCIGGKVDLDKAPLSLPLMLWGLLTALTLTIGRGGFGPTATFESRYVTLMVPGLLGSYLAVPAIKQVRMRNVFSVFVLVVACAGVLASFDGTYDQGGDYRDRFRAMHQTLLEYESRPDVDLQGLFVSSDLVRKGAKTLQTYHLSVFRNAE